MNNMKEVQDSINVQIPKEHLVRARSRDSLVLEYCKGAKVLHIGAADWPYTKKNTREVPCCTLVSAQLLLSN